MGLPRLAVKRTEGQPHAENASLRVVRDGAVDRKRGNRRELTTAELAAAVSEVAGLGTTNGKLVGFAADR